jgi:hypothetical protein
MQETSHILVNGARSSERMQTRLSLYAAGAIIATALGVNSLAHSAYITQRLVRWDLQRFENGTERYMDRENFVDSEDRLLLQELPQADYSRGGAYFFGTSSMKWGTKLWSLPPQERARVHNYGIGATNHASQGHFIKYLLDDAHLAGSHGRQTMLVIGLYWSMGLDWERGFFESLWDRHGVYTITASNEIHDRPISRWKRRFLIEKACTSSFLLGVSNRLARRIVEKLGIVVSTPLGATGVNDIRRYFEMYDLTRDWEAGLDHQMDALDHLWSCVRAHNVQCTFVILPARAMVRQMPQAVTYNARIHAFCEEHVVPLVDLTDLLDEDGFWDVNHTSPAGLDKLHAELMRIIEPHLRAIGALN